MCHRSRETSANEANRVEIMNDLPGALELLTSRVDDLDRRVHALEHQSETVESTSDSSPASSFTLSTDNNSPEQASGVFALLGRGMLGLAGAYVLRAVAESGALPRIATAWVAVAYGMAWLVLAAWSKRPSRLTQVTYAVTSALILAPMLWELTLHFKTFSPLIAAAILAVYMLLATLISWRRSVPVAWVAHSAAALTALSLGIGAHSMLPFIAVLLVCAALSEYAALKRGEAGISPLVLFVSDLAIWGLIFIYSGPPSARADYPDLGAVVLIIPAWLLWMINAICLTVKTVLLQKRMTVFEALQVMIAFGLAVSGTLIFAPNSGRTWLGTVCVLLAAASYVALFRRMLPSAEQRNILVFSAWCAILTLAGVTWLLPTVPAAICLGAGALVAIVFGGPLRSVLLELHGLVFLIAAAFISRSPQYAFGELAGSLPVKPGLSLIAAAVCAAAFYAASKERPGEEWQRQILHFIPALLAAFALSALLVQALLGLVGTGVHLEPHHVAFIRTLTLCVVSVAFAFGGSRLGRLEMTRIAYSVLAFVAAKLLFEDLTHGRMEFTAGSIFLVALTLIAVPRLMRSKAKAPMLAHEREESILQKHV